MKLIELLNKIANNEIEEGTKINTNLKKGLVFKDGTLYYEDTCEDIIVTFTGITQKGLDAEVGIIEEKQQQGRWKPKEREHYYFIDSCKEIYRCTWSDARLDNWRYTTKNVFKTKQEAQEYLEYKTALLEAEKPFVKGKENRFIILEENKPRAGFVWNTQYAGGVCLGQDETVAQAFVDKWRKQILKYEFGIEE